MKTLGLPTHRAPGGALASGPVYCPTYIVDGTQGTHPDKVVVDDAAYTADTEEKAATIALMRRVDTELAGLIWTRKIGVVTLAGLLSRKGKVGPLDVLFFAGPTFDNGRRSDDAELKRRVRAGLPTGLPGSRRVVQADAESVAETARRFWKLRGGR